MRLQAVEYRDRGRGETVRLEAPSVFLFLGAVPLHLLAPGDRRPRRQGLHQDRPRPRARGAGPARSAPHACSRRSLPRVYAVGDVRSGSVKRVASAVGEGSIVVQFIHRALNGG